MNDRIAPGPARPVARALALTLTTSLLTIALGSTVFAQTPAAQPKAAPRPPAAAPKGAPAAPKPGEASPPQASAEPQPPQLIYSPWTKFCLNGQETNAKKVCFTGKDGRLESGAPVVSAVVIEPEGEPKRLRVTLPVGMMLAPGTRVIVDQGQPMNAPYVICFANGCMSDYEASNELIEQMKKGQVLVMQSYNADNRPISLVLPLTDFAKAFDGPPVDPKTFAEKQQKLEEDLQKRAEEARKKLESQQSAAPTR